MTDDRFRPDDAVLSDFGGEVLAVCPSCGGCVRVRDRRAACPRCAWSRTAEPGTTYWGDAADPWLRLPLWLVTDVAGHVLWAYNDEHLTHVESYVRAGLRERGEHDPARPRPMVDKLPGWLKEAKHRDAVLAGVAVLRRRLAEA